MRNIRFAGTLPTSLVAVATIVLVALFANAQAGVSGARTDKKPTIKNLTNRTLQRTTLQASDSSVSTSCTGSGCISSTAVFARPIACTAPAGKTCTFYLHLESQGSVSASDNGLFKFLVDGLTPVPGPTDSNGFLSWVDGDPNSVLPAARSYAVVAKVRNSGRNQVHSIEVDIGCQDTTGDSCSATMGFASLSTAVYTP
jgi:hypothetical protein